MGLKGVNVVTVSIRRAQGGDNKKQLLANSMDPVKRKTNRCQCVVNFNMLKIRN